MQRNNKSDSKHSVELLPLETFTVALSPLVVVGLLYWKNAFLELIAMACEYSVPQFFATITANEFGWSDMKQAIDGGYFAENPVGATRHYHYGWNLFKNMFLKPGLKSPIGTIERTWFRQEDQSRGSLHVHMAIWIKPGTENPAAINGTAPRECTSPEEHAWHNFVLKVQTHNCKQAVWSRCGCIIKSI